MGERFDLVDGRELAERMGEAAARVVALGCERRLTMATAESCTAGMVAAAVGGVPGASAVLRGGAVTYCNEIKHGVLGVAQDTLDAYTAVSEPTAREMAVGSQRMFGASAAVALTGYAGPGGGTEEEPAGSVYIATCDDDAVLCERHVFTGTRNEVRAKAAVRALEMIAERFEVL